MCVALNMLSSHGSGEQGWTQLALLSLLFLNEDNLGTDDMSCLNCLSKNITV